MTVSLFTFVDLFTRHLGTAEHLLTKGAAHAAAHGLSEEAVLDWRLIDDMHPLRFQLMVVCNFAQQWPARVAGLPVPEAVGDQLDLAGLKAAIAGAKAFLAGLTAEQFEGRDSVLLTYAIAQGMEPTLESGHWLSVFATTNLMFHLSTAYAILRAKGVPLGKPDLFVAGL
ncbi:DUF1993 domain-containing protein [Caulobacter sp. DWR2-3-1b2]|uniref:DUF1993 domain-containing protein n=1 Tax=unclassified Caulobacter TaxID=2648921 RepID=UPI003CEA4AA7